MLLQKENIFTRFVKLVATVFLYLGLAGHCLKNYESFIIPAVIKPDESQQRLVQPSTEQVDDDKRQFAVSLELSFLCNSANGQPKIWGVIVAQEELALG